MSAEEEPTAGAFASGVDSQRTGLRKVQLQPLKIRDPTALSGLVKICESGFDLVQHVVFAAPSGPFVGSGRAFQGQEDLLHRFFAHQFAAPALRQYSIRESSSNSPTIPQRLQAHGVVDLTKLAYTEEVFEWESKRFLVCLMCGTSMTCATKILEHLDLAMAAGRSHDPLAVLVSGGHTAMAVHLNKRWRIYGETEDITLGNLLDMFAREAKLPSPGGVAVEGST